MKDRVPTLLATAIASALAVAPAAADVPESPDPIRVAVNEWTGQQTSARIAGELLKRMGYAVEYVTAGSYPQFSAMAQGTLHFQPEVWSNGTGDIFPKALAAGEIAYIGPLGLEPQEGWVYPPYVAELCPGLPDYRALFDCAQVFATPDTFPKGRIVAYPADWGTRTHDVVAAIGLPFVAVPGGSEGAMIAELRSAMAAREPILMMMWRPHWLFAKYELDFVAWNPSETCPEEKQTRDDACGFEQATVAKVVWSGFEEKWPAAFRFLEALTITNETQNAMINAIDQEGRPLAEVVDAWIAENEDLWQAWIAGARG